MRMAWSCSMALSAIDCRATGAGEDMEGREMTGNAGTAPRRTMDRAALSRNGKMGALIREATLTDPERVRLGKMAHQGLRDKWEHELDPDGKLRARNPAR